MSIIEEAKKVFLTDVDEETFKENLEDIQSWEKSIIESEALVEWQNNDVTKMIISKVKSEYIQASLLLAHKRELTDAERVALFAKKDACLLMIELMASNAKSHIDQLHQEIRQKIALVSG